MYKWLRAYITQFGQDFPLAAVIDLNEYEIVRIIQECCESGKAYDTGGEPVAGKAKVGMATI